MDKPLPLSVALITKNEALNLPRCLASVRELAAEIVILDCGSSDETPAIARAHGAVFAVADWPGFVVQKNCAFARCTQPWVLGLDADEALTPELAGSIRQAFAAGEPAEDGFWLNRRTFYLGEWVWHAWYPEWRLRLARRDRAQWTGLDPHPKLVVPGATRRLPGDLLHYSFVDLEDQLRRTITYARVMARSYAAHGRRFRWHRWLLSPGVAFFKHLVLKQGFRDGWRGWLISGIRAFDVFAKYALLLEQERCPAGSGNPAPGALDKSPLPPKSEA